MNLPNKLSFLRIILVPLIMFFYLATFIPFGKVVAIVLFIVAALTDLFDGKIARARGLVTDLGKLLDPIADKMLITCSLFLIVLDGTIAHPWGIIALTILFTRDCIVNGIRQIAATKGVVVAAVWSGKIKAILAYTYLPMFMLLAQFHILQSDMLAGSQVFDTIVLIFSILCYIVLAAGTLVTAWSAIDYTLKNKSVIMPKPEEKQAEENSQEEDKVEAVEEEKSGDNEQNSEENKEE